MREKDAVKARIAYVGICPKCSHVVIRTQWGETVTCSSYACDWFARSRDMSAAPDPEPPAPMTLREKVRKLCR